MFCEKDKNSTMLLQAHRASIWANVQFAYAPRNACNMTGDEMDGSIDTDTTSASLTPADLQAQLQRRVARLLLRHDHRTFRGRFRELFTRSTLPQPAQLRAYDEYVKLLALAGELLDEILPRIRRQMSFQATREILDEEPPLRGQIDWPTSLTRAWAERPDQPPTRFTTTLRRRSFATPENMLVVAVLYAYARALKQMRTQSLFVDAPLTEGETDELRQLEDRVRRSLATTHFRALAREAQTFHPPDLIGSVERHLRPGKNAYRDLIAWWRRFQQLHLRQGSSRQATRVLDDEAQLSLLYQLWIALELVGFLAEHNALDEPHIQTDQLRITFTWQGRQFRLVYDRQPKAHLAWEGAPGERPDYFITRADPLIVKDKQTNQTIWHEPGVLLDAKCFTGQQPDRATGAIKRMLADLQLVDATRGILILPDIANLPADRLHPKTERYLGSVDPALEIQLHALRPLEQIDILRVNLRRLLDQVAASLPEREPIACHGFLQDVDTINPGGTAPRRCPDSDAVLALCPKPHISARRIDLVSPTHDCLQQPHLCHIMGLEQFAEALPPFIRRVQSQEQLIETIEQLRRLVRNKIAVDDHSPEADVARSQLLHAIGTLTETYREFRQPDTLDIEEKLELIFGQYWQQSADTPRGLPEEVRQMLISGEYVRGELKKAGIQDWAACAVQYVRALELELKRRLYQTSGNPSKLQMPAKKFTYGTVTTAYNQRHTSPHWQVFLSEAVHPSQADPAAFAEVIGALDPIRIARNNIAHGVQTTRTDAETVRDRILRGPDGGHKGILPRLVAMLNAPVP